LRTGEHLTDEESAVVPLINAHGTEQEWREATARGAAFMSRRNVKLALVLGGMVLDGSPDEERRRFLAGVPLPQRLLVRLLADGRPRSIGPNFAAAVSPPVVPARCRRILSGRRGQHFASDHAAPRRYRVRLTRK
jgi:hypothetical protein